MPKALPFPILLCLLWALAPGASALTITSDAPGNVFVAGTPVRLMLNDAQGQVSYELTDYFGRKGASGAAESAIELPGLKPGWYELKCNDSAGELVASIGVVMDRGGAPLPADGRICTDVAAAWLVDQSKYRAVARMMRTAGVSWARERLSWRGTEPERGKIDWNRYQAVADAYQSEGIHLYQMWHDSPDWSHPDKKGSVCPDDLRDVYRYTRAAASHFAGQIEAWEIWNEPDLGFWVEQSDRFSGFLKAAYLGLKDGNPNALVLQGALLYGVTDFARGIYECGTPGYFDAFNWHSYKKPSAYHDVLTAHLALLKQYAAADRPVWLTECGIPLPGAEDVKGLPLSTNNQREQCRFMPRSAAMSLAAGTDKHFYFVLPSYTEGKTQFGALRPDLTPYPSFLALSTAANIIGESAYKGEFKTGSDAVTAQVFSTRRGNVLVAWSDTDAEVTVPTDRNAVRVANIFGEESSIPSENGAVRIKIGPDAQYLLDIGKPIERKLTGRPRPRGRMPRLQPSRIIVASHAPLPIFKDNDVYTLSSRNAFDYTVQVYNFDEKRAASGTVELAVPDGWAVESPKRSVALEAMGREVLTFRVTPGELTTSRFKITARARFGRERVAPCVSSLRYDFAAMIPVERESLTWAQDADRWIPQASPNCALTIRNVEPGVLHLDTKFDSQDDRWAYPLLRFAQPMDMSGYDAIAFDLHIPEDSYASSIRLVLVEQGGAAYMGTTRSLGKKHRVALPFVTFEPFDQSAPDPNKRLDLNAISAVKFGCRAGRDYLIFDVSGFELVKLDKP